MPENIEGNTRAQAAKGFLTQIKLTVDNNTPVFVPGKNGEELNPNLKNIAKTLSGSLARMAGINLNDNEITYLAKAGEAAAKLQKAVSQNQTGASIKQLQEERNRNFENLLQNNQKLE